MASGEAEQHLTVIFNSSVACTMLLFMILILVMLHFASESELRLIPRAAHLALRCAFALNAYVSTAMAWRPLSYLHFARREVKTSSEDFCEATFVDSPAKHDLLRWLLCAGRKTHGIFSRW